MSQPLPPLSPSPARTALGGGGDAPAISPIPMHHNSNNSRVSPSPSAPQQQQQQPSPTSSVGGLTLEQLDAARKQSVEVRMSLGMVPVKQTRFSPAAAAPEAMVAAFAALGAATGNTNWPSGVTPPKRQTRIWGLDEREILGNDAAAGPSSRVEGVSPPREASVPSAAKSKSWFKEPIVSAAIRGIAEKEAAANAAAGIVSPPPAAAAAARGHSRSPQRTSSPSRAHSRQQTIVVVPEETEEQQRRRQQYAELEERRRMALAEALLRRKEAEDERTRRVEERRRQQQAEDMARAREAELERDAERLRQSVPDAAEIVARATAPVSAEQIAAEEAAAAADKKRFKEERKRKRAEEREQAAAAAAAAAATTAPAANAAAPAADAAAATPEKPAVAAPAAAPTPSRTATPLDKTAAPAGAKLPVAPVVEESDPPPVVDPAVQARFIADVLAVHNAMRKAHGAPPLTWSDDCARSARLAAEKCAQLGKLEHCFYESQSTGKRHGQNLYYHSRAATVSDGCTGWYNEVYSPGYTYALGDSRTFAGTGHFTQLVWHATECCGAALSADGKYLAVNYFPAGNVKGKYVANVRAAK